ncbi:MAG: SDR family oxidoreductase [Planctomycetota bacterium]|nr:MAG: SDR family oxidoreductase [Planctomycetota bacterium]
MTQYLVTGGAGFIGSHIVERLVEDGHPVRVLDNLSTGRLENLRDVVDDVEFIEGDITDASTVARAMRGVDVVFHQAALASVPRSVERPLDTHHACVTGTVNVLDAARRAGVRRVVYAASSSAYGNQPQLPKHEGQLPEVLSPYAAAKLAGELYCQAFARCYSLETVCLRYFNVFGPRQDPNSPYAAVIPLFVSALLDGRRPTIFGDGKQSRDFTFVANVVTANLLAADAPNVSGRVYNVACGHSLSVLELLQKICDLLGVPCDPEFAPPRPGDVRDSWADIRAAARDLRYAPIVDFDTGLKQTVAYYVAEHRRRTSPSVSTEDV